MFKNGLAVKILGSYILSGLILSLCIIYTSTASAEILNQFEFQVVDGYGSSNAILDGDYQEAVKLAKSSAKKGTAYDRAVNANSLCVAYAKMADVDLAVDACSNAVKASRRLSNASNINRIARNNRNVLRALAHSAN